MELGFRQRLLTEPERCDRAVRLDNDEATLREAVFFCVPSHDPAVRGLWDGLDTPGGAIEHGLMRRGEALPFYRCLCSAGRLPEPIGGILLSPALYGPDPIEARFGISVAFVLITAQFVEFIGVCLRLLYGVPLGGW